MNVLILAGTGEASALAHRLAGHPAIRARLSLAGRTRQPEAQELPCRVGGFGGVEGLVRYLRDEGIDAMVDATHPFAAGMTANAAAAARASGTPLAVLARPDWTPEPDDRWLRVPDLEGAAEALRALGRRVLVTTGRQLAAFERVPDKRYVIRTVDPPEPRPALPDAVYLQSRGPFRLEDELALLREHAIDALVTKASGGGATRPKLDAARQCGIPVIMVQRPPRPEGIASFTEPADVVFWLEQKARG